MYLKKLYRELRIWNRVSKVAKANRTILENKGFRVDWIGRIYTVINLPEEVANHNPEVQQMYILGKLRDFDKIFLELGIADYVAPEFKVIEDTASYLLVLSPDREYVRLLPFLWFTIKTMGLALLLRIIWVIGKHNWKHIYELWEKTINLIF